MVIGYSNGYFDLFHVGHLNLLLTAKSLCDKLIVGVISDDECKRSKNKDTIICMKDRLKIVQNLNPVDLAVPVYNDDKLYEWNKYKYNVLFVGDDHINTNDWIKNERALIPKGVVFVYIPYTITISTSQIIEKIHNNQFNKEI